jgi:hypothetical protein
MRAAVVLLVGFQFFARSAWAETQVKAEDCSSAVSGTMFFSKVENNCQQGRHRARR